MLSREMESRATYLFYSHIHSAVLSVEPPLKKPMFFSKDVFVTPRKKLHALKKLLSAYHQDMINQENARVQYAVPKHLYKAESIAAQKLTEAERDLAMLLVDIKSEEKRLAEERDIIATQLKLEESQRNADDSVDVQNVSVQYSQLTGELSQLLTEKNEIEARIDKKCCGPFFGRVRKEGLELAKIEEKLRKTADELTRLNPIKARHDAKIKKIEDLQRDLTASAQKLMNHAGESPQKIKVAEDRVRRARVESEVAALDIKKSEARYYAAVSARQMDNVRLLYDAFVDFKKEMDLHQVNKDLAFTKDRLDELLEQIWSPDYDNKSAMQIDGRMSA